MKHDSMAAMRKALEQHKICWMCEYCGKTYPSYQKLVSTACHSHPDGAWAGKCHVPNAVKMTGETFEEICKRSQARTARTVSECKSFNAASKKIIKDIPLARFSHKIMTEWTSDEVKDTIQIIRQNCDAAIRSGIWNDHSGQCTDFKQDIQRLKNAVTDQEFWSAFFWLTQANLSDENGNPLPPFYEQGNRALVTAINAVALCAKNNLGNPIIRDLQICFSAFQMNAKYGQSIHKSWIPFLEKMEKEVIPDSGFWYTLYCLLRTSLTLG